MGKREEYWIVKQNHYLFLKQKGLEEETMAKVFLWKLIQ